MSKKKEPEFKDELHNDDIFADLDKMLADLKTNMVWTNVKETLANAVISTLTKNVTDIAVAQYLTEYQKMAIKAYRDKVLTLVDYYLHHHSGVELPGMLEDCKKSFDRLALTCTSDIENEDKFANDGEPRPIVILNRAINEANHWALMGDDEWANGILESIVLDHNNICGFYSKKIEDVAEMFYHNGKVFSTEPTPEELTNKGEETLDFYLDRPEIDDSEKLKLQKTLNFNLPLSDVKKIYKNYGAYKTRFNNIFKKAVKDEVVMTDDDYKAILQYLEEHLWFSAKAFSKGEEIVGDPIEGWALATAITEGVYLSIVKALGYPTIREYYNSNVEFSVSLKETLFNAMYLLCFYLTQLEDLNIISRLYKTMDDITEEYGPDTNIEFKLADFFYFLEDIYEYYL